MNHLHYAGESCGALDESGAVFRVFPPIRVLLIGSHVGARFTAPATL